jgi:hypothetical protein
MRVVKLTDIRINGGTQCRVVLSQPKIYEYVERMKEGDEFPQSKPGSMARRIG